MSPYEPQSNAVIGNRFSSRRGNLVDIDPLHQFDQYDRTNLGRIDLSSATVTEFPLTLNGDFGTSAIINGPDNRLWLGGNQTIYAPDY